MRILKMFVISLVVMVTAVSGSAETPLHGGQHVEKVDQLLESAISHGLVTGGVVLVGNHEGVLFEKVYGRGLGGLDSASLTTDTLFDIASLTKVVATTPAIMKLAEERKLSLVDPVVKWFPEFSGKGKDDLLVLNLLTHTSGLDDFPLSADNPRQSAIEGAAQQRLKGEIGSRFRYADINFILLGELVRRVSGVGLNEYVADRFYGPLGMRDTGFKPDPAKAIRCAATRGSDNQLLQGQVQDYPARQLGGVAGHAGLFTSIHDLARFCRMILNDGELDSVRVLSERAVRQMTVPYFSRGGGVMRGLGWDIASPFSSPKGNGFSRYSFGHTGYSGSSIWIDPATDTFVVLLTSRVEYAKTKEFNRLRSELSTLAASLFAVPPELAGMTRDADE
ncbi:serine hydrolase [Geobacter sp. AOG1]|uniref:serine hydrolase domain-containing protein n=1 Tax=Geobacter sp. AOG1 TaxID=1566346 RepID=UPI001CC3C78F|nr:serine hydrolase domain-containing protein [Geobacter sp. AOG1]